jgi:transporter family protein
MQPKPSETRSLATTGEVWIVGAILGFAGSNFFDRVAVVQTDPLVSALVKSVPSLVFAVILLTTRGTWTQMRAASPRYIGHRALWLFVLSGVLSIGGLMIYFAALRIAGLVVTVPFLQTQILWATLIGWVFMKERFSAHALVGIATVLVGLMLLSYGQMMGRPVSDRWFVGIPLALGAAIAFGATGAIARAGQLKGADQSTGMFLRFAVSLVLALAALVVTGKLGLIGALTPRDAGALLLSGVLNGVIAIYCFFTALRLMSVGRAFALNGLNPIVAVFLGWLFLREYINMTMIAGIVLTSLGIILVQVYKPKEQQVR